MFHRSCEAFRTSLLARIADLESENQRLVDKLLEERTDAAHRELELVDRVLAVANPLAARAVMMARSTSPASPLPVMEKERPPQSARRAGVRPVLTPTASGFRPLADLMDRQRQRVVGHVTTAGPATANASPPEEEEETDPSPSSEAASPDDLDPTG